MTSMGIEANNFEGFDNQSLAIRCKTSKERVRVKNQKRLQYICKTSSCVNLNEKSVRGNQVDKRRRLDNNYQNDFEKTTDSGGCKREGPINGHIFSSKL